MGNVRFPADYVGFTPENGPNSDNAATAAPDPKEKWAIPEEAERWSMTTLREKLVKIGAKVVRHGRYITFQLAEVAIPRALFVEILRLIDGLRPAPLPP